MENGQYRKWAQLKLTLLWDTCSIHKMSTVYNITRSLMKKFLVDLHEMNTIDNMANLRLHVLYIKWVQMTGKCTCVCVEKQSKQFEILKNINICATGKR